jgi:hypothetical protein
MYEGDSWYNAFVPRTAKAPETSSKHRRRVSLLKQPHVSPYVVRRLRRVLLTMGAAGDSG